MYISWGAWFIFSVLGTTELLIERSRRKRRLQMDAEEFKRELRESEGNFEVKAVQRSLQQEILLHDLIQGVRKSKVVIVD